MQTVKEHLDYLTSFQKSGNLTFQFDPPKESNLSTFAVYGKGDISDHTGIFGSNYLVEEKEGKVIIRYQAKNQNKLLLIKDKPFNYRYAVGSYVELDFTEFKTLLESDQFYVGDVDLSKFLH